MVVILRKRNVYWLEGVINLVEGDKENEIERINIGFHIRVWESNRVMEVG